MASSDIQFLASPGGRLHGTLRVPGDKSISHRSIMLGALATMTAAVVNYFFGSSAGSREKTRLSDAIHTFSEGRYGASDGTRTRGLRRDRPAL